MANAWQIHVKNTMAQNPGKSLRDCLVMAKKTYKKGTHVPEHAAPPARKSKKAKKTKKMKKTKGKKAKKAKKTKKAKKSKKSKK